MSEKNSFLVFSGTNTRYLAEKICASLNCQLGNLIITKFSDGEFAVSYEESIRGRDVFLVQSTFPNSDNLMELLLMIDSQARIGKTHQCGNSLLRMGTSGPQRQATRKHWRQTCGRPAELCRCRPRHYNGFARRPDSGILRRTRRPPLRIWRHPISSPTCRA